MIKIVANSNLVNLCRKKFTMGRLDLEFSGGKTATQFQEYMTRVFYRLI